MQTDRHTRRRTSAAGRHQRLPTRKRRFSWPVLVCMLCLLLAVTGRGDEAETYKSLVANSPFLTPAFKARLGQRDTSALSFAGYTRVGKEWSFSIIDRKAKTGYWLKLNEEQNKIKVVRFDEKAEKIHVEVGGFGVDLSLDRGK
jgi:hypothetical protein